MNDFLVPVQVSLAMIFVSFLILNIYEHRTFLRRWLVTYQDEHSCWECTRKYIAFQRFELWRLRLRFCKHEVILRRYMERNRVPAVAKYTIVMP